MEVGSQEMGAPTAYRLRNRGKINEPHVAFVGYAYLSILPVLTAFSRSLGFYNFSPGFKDV